MTDQDIVQAYEGGASMNDLMKMSCRSNKSLRFLLHANGVEIRDKLTAITVYASHDRGQRGDDFGARYIPTLEEIEMRAAEVRQKWTERERVGRIVSPQNVEVHTCKMFRKCGKSTDAEG